MKKIITLFIISMMAINIGYSAQKEKSKTNPLSIMKVKDYVRYNGGNCLTLCKRMLKKHGLNEHGYPGAVYRLMHEVGKGKSRKLVNFGDNPAQNYKNAIESINRHLDNNRPVIIGVNHTVRHKTGRNEGATDHYIVIVGKGYDAKLKRHFFTYFDPATKDVSVGTDVNANRLIYDPINHTLSDKTPVMKVGDGVYRVTQVRPNDGKSKGTVNLYAK